MLASGRKKSLSIDVAAEKFTVQIVLEAKHPSKPLLR
jgi:hypothetical protein